MNWGIIGLGKIANKAAETFSFLRQEGEKLTAVASRDYEKAREFGEKYGAEKFYGSYSDIYKDKDVIQIESREILLGGGNIHCITMQIPDVKG